MKRGLYILPVILLVASCTHKANEMPAPLVLQNNSSTTTTVAAHYDTATYRGSYTETSWAYEPAGQAGSFAESSIGNTNFVFCTTRINDSEFVLWNVSEMYMSGNPAFTGITDTFVYSSGSFYLSHVMTSRNNNALVLGVDTLDLSNGLSFGWSYERPICGDYEYHYYHFTGKRD